MYYNTIVTKWHKTTQNIIHYDKIWHDITTITNTSQKSNKKVKKIHIIYNNTH